LLVDMRLRVVVVSFAIIFLSWEHFPRGPKPGPKPWSRPAAASFFDANEYTRVAFFKRRIQRDSEYMVWRTDGLAARSLAEVLECVLLTVAPIP
jgi:hypothetical protein